MAKLTWNNYVEIYETGYCINTAIPSKFNASPKRLGKNNKKFPTPYGLLQEYLNQKLSGDWTSQTLKDRGQMGIQFLLDDEEDVNAFLSIFSKYHERDKNAKPDLYRKVYVFDYGNAEYQSMASSLGYI